MSKEKLTVVVVWGFPLIHTYAFKLSAESSTYPFRIDELQTSVYPSQAIVSSLSVRYSLALFIGGLAAIFVPLYGTNIAAEG